MIWLIAPVFAFLWLYKSWSFWKAAAASALIRMVLLFFSKGIGFGLLAIFIACCALWVYGDAQTRKIRFPLLYAAIALILPGVGILIYILFRGVLSQMKIETIEGEDGKIQMFNDVNG